MKLLTEKEAYRAMFLFLDNLYWLSGSDDIGALLGSMVRLDDGKPRDPALGEDWQESVQRALDEGENGVDGQETSHNDPLTAKQAYRAMFLFLENWYNLSSWDDIGALLSSMAMLDDGKPADPALRKNWQESVQQALDEGENGVDWARYWIQ